MEIYIDVISNMGLIPGLYNPKEIELIE